MLLQLLAVLLSLVIQDLRFVSEFFIAPGACHESSLQVNPGCMCACGRPITAFVVAAVVRAGLDSSANMHRQQVLCAQQLHRRVLSAIRAQWTAMLSCCCCRSCCRMCCCCCCYCWLDLMLGAFDATAAAATPSAADAAAAAEAAVVGAEVPFVQRHDQCALTLQQQVGCSSWCCCCCKRRAWLCLMTVVIDFLESGTERAAVGTHTRARS